MKRKNPFTVIRKKMLSRMGITILQVLLEAMSLLFLMSVLRPYTGWIEMMLRFGSVFVVLGIISYSRHLSADMMWIVLIMFMPVGGILGFVFIEVLEHFDSKTYKGLRQEADAAEKLYIQDERVLEKAMKSSPRLAGQYQYFRNQAGYAVYENRGFDYYPLGELGFEAIKDELRKAEKFIFLEYFIIEPGEMWNSILLILQEKARAGLDVRVLYDDLGSMNTLPAKYTKILEEMGIKAQAFNRINPNLNGIMNHRDHRKILVIDGRVSFSGGINLADEYINTKVRFGHWKDNCIRFEGEAVWSNTVLFLSMWNALRHEDEDYTKFRCEGTFSEKAPDGYIVPYGDSPLDDKLIGEEVYMNILNNARDYCYIVTPYLIIDTDLMNALILTAQRGVDVRIITPGIPDKKIVWKITRSMYYNLIRGGVRIYEYTPGFNHGKVFVSDDLVATVGTINLDYRSLYLHFENGVELFESEKILDIKKDFLETCEKSHLMSVEETRNGLIKGFFYMVIKVFAPMM